MTKILKMETTIHKTARLQLSDGTKRIIVDIICYLFILLFIYAAVNKLIEYEKFKVQLGQSPMLTKYTNQIALFIPAIEIIISLLLFFPKTQKLGLYASFSLMTMFTTYIIFIMNFSEHVPCSCGGILEKMGWTEHLIFNILFVILGIIGILIQSNLEHKKIP